MKPNCIKALMLQHQFVYVYLPFKEPLKTFFPETVTELWDYKILFIEIACKLYIMYMDIGNTVNVYFLTSLSYIMFTLHINDCWTVATNITGHSDIIKCNHKAHRHKRV